MCSVPSLTFIIITMNRIHINNNNNAHTHSYIYSRYNFVIILVSAATPPSRYRNPSYINHLNREIYRLRDNESSLWGEKQTGQNYVLWQLSVWGSIMVIMKYIIFRIVYILMVYEILATIKDVLMSWSIEKRGFRDFSYFFLVGCCAICL